MRPDFIGIGTEKAATTWLYNILKIHPNVWVPPTKELRFFNDLDMDSSHFHRLVSSGKGSSISRNRFRLNHIKNLRWAYTYLFKKRTLENYFSLFKSSDKQIAGEITPSYGILDDEKVAHVFSCIPKTKIIYILRNPIYRDWSSVCMNYKNVYKLPIEDQPVDEIIKKVTAPHKIRHSNYIANLDRWGRFYSEEQIFVGFYKELKESPYSFLKRLFQFLELSNHDLSNFDSLISRKINPVSKQIPFAIKTAIAKSEHENILAAHRKFNNDYTYAWVKEVEDILNGN